jgi:hypothetical protein
LLLSCKYWDVKHCKYIFESTAVGDNLLHRFQESMMKYLFVQLADMQATKMVTNSLGVYHSCILFGMDISLILLKSNLFYLKKRFGNKIRRLTQFYEMVNGWIDEFMLPKVNYFCFCT